MTSVAIRPAIFRIAIFVALWLGVGLLITATTWMSVAVLTILLGGAAVGLVVVLGHAGQISVAHAVFWGIGAYAVGIVSHHTSFSTWLAMPIGLALAGLTAYAVARPILRLEGHYLAMGTAALNLIFVALLVEQFALTGGLRGLGGIRSLSLFGLSLFEPRAYYLFVFPWIAGLVVLANGFLGSRIGLLLRAMSSDSRSARLSGVDIQRLKTLAFVIGALFAAVTGFFYAHFISLVSPQQADILPSILFIAMIAIGGMRSVYGAFVGAFLVVAIRRILPANSEVVFAVFFILAMMFARDGLTGLFSKAVKRLRAVA